MKYGHVLYRFLEIYPTMQETENSSKNLLLIKPYSVIAKIQSPANDMQKMFSRLNFVKSILTTVKDDLPKLREQINKMKE